MTLVHLDRVDTPEPGRDGPGGADHPMRRVTRQVAFEPDGWTEERRRKVVELFDSLAPDWHTRGGPARYVPVDDALERGGSWTSGPVLEIGSGVGLVSEHLEARLGEVIALDLSLEMLLRAPAVPPRVLADTAHLPVPDASVATVVLMNMFLFPAEMDRVLAPGGALVWINSLGDLTPIHLTAEEVHDALPGDWDVVASEAGWGTWATARRSVA
jgi:SAM-dependent methyltransferase